MNLGPIDVVPCAVWAYCNLNADVKKEERKRGNKKRANRVSDRIAENFPVIVQNK